MYNESNSDWTDGNLIPVMVDDYPYNVWSAWDALQRDIFFLYADGSYGVHFNITSWDYDNICNTILEMLPEDTLQGDSNGDGVINVLDIVIMVNIVLGNEPYNPIADMNGDNIVNVLDIVILVGIILGE